MTQFHFHSDDPDVPSSRRRDTIDTLQEELEEALRDLELNELELPPHERYTEHETYERHTYSQSSPGWLRVATGTAAACLALALGLTHHSEHAPQAPPLPEPVEKPNSDRQPSPSQPLETRPPPESIPESETQPQTKKATSMKELCLQNRDKYAIILAGGATGSSSVVDTAGIMLTNYHVVEGVMPRGKVTVKFLNGSSFTGTVVATDKRRDLALIKFTPESPLTAFEIASLKEGLQQKVCAIGTPFGKPGQVAVGKTVDRPDEKRVLTTAQLAPGYSGGPMLNEEGKLVGVSVEIVPGSGKTGWGDGVAIRSEFAKELLEKYKRKEAE